MIKLISIELKKVLSKKSIYVMMIIMLLFNLLNNILFYTDYDNDGNYKHLEPQNLTNEKDLLEQELSKYNFNNISDTSIYIKLKTKLDIINLKENYKINSWQYNKVEDYLYEKLNNINIYTYQIKDTNLLNKETNELKFLLKKFEEDNWQYFANLEIVNLEKKQSLLHSQLEIITDKEEQKNIENLISDNDLNIAILKYRLSNNIKEDSNFINIALNNYKKHITGLKYYETNDKLTNAEIQEYQKQKTIFEESKYIIKNKINYNKQNNINYQLRTIVEDYEIFIIILILIVASTIVAEEIQTGTIKLLLIKPYSRGKILLSKYLTVIIVLMLIICYLIFLQLIIGSAIFGFSSLKVPVIVYDFNKEVILEYNVFIYMLIRIITRMPMLIMMLTISFSLSTIINNIALSITIPLFIYMFAPTINYFIMHYNLNILKYFISANWNFNKYLFGKIYEIEGINLKFSLIVFSIYFIAITMFTYINFKKKNIRNV